MSQEGEKSPEKQTEPHAGQTFILNFNNEKKTVVRDLKTVQEVFTAFADQFPFLAEAKPTTNTAQLFVEGQELSDESLQKLPESAEIVLVSVSSKSGVRDSGERSLAEGDSHTDTKKLKPNPEGQSALPSDTSPSEEHKMEAGNTPVEPDPNSSEEATNTVAEESNVGEQTQTLETPSVDSTSAPTNAQAPTDPTITPPAEESEAQSQSQGEPVRIGKLHVVKIRGIPWGSTEADIEKFFAGCNMQEEDGIYMVRSSTGKVSGEAFIVFTDKESFDTAMSRDKQHMGSRYIDVYKSDMEEMNTMKKRMFEDGTIKPVDSASAVVRLRGLPYSATERDVKDFFGADPTLGIVGVHLVRDNSGRPRGEAYVETPSEADAKKAMAFHKKYMGSRYVEVFESSVREMEAAGSRQGRRDSREPHRSSRRSRSRSRERDHYSSRSRANYYDRYSSYPPPRSHHSSYRSHSSYPEACTCLRMQGIPFEATDGDITRFFQEAGVVPLRIHRKQSGGEAFIEFSSASESARAMTRNRQHIGRRYVELFLVPYREVAETVGLPLEQPGAPAPYYPPQTAAHASYGYDPYAQAAPRADPYAYHAAPAHGYDSARSGYDRGAAYDRQHPSPQSMLPSVATGNHPRGRTLKLKGLPFRVTEGEIVDFFRGYDVVETSVEIGKNQQGRPSGEAWVEFRTEQGARRAMADRNRQYIGDRYVKLFIE